MNPLYYLRSLPMITTPDFFFFFFFFFLNVWGVYGFPKLDY